MSERFKPRRNRLAPTEPELWSKPGGDRLEARPGAGDAPCYSTPQGKVLIVCK